jgi:hypothetical protein
MLGVSGASKNESRSRRENTAAHKARSALDTLFGKAEKPTPKVDAFKKLFGD